MLPVLSFLIYLEMTLIIKFVFLCNPAAYFLLLHWPANKSFQRRFWSHMPGFKSGLHHLLSVTLSQLLNLPCWIQFISQGPNTVTNAVSSY